MRGLSWRGQLSAWRSPRKPLLFLAVCHCPPELQLPHLGEGEIKGLLGARCSFRGLSPASVHCFCWEGRSWLQMG